MFEVHLTQLSVKCGKTLQPYLVSHFSLVLAVSLHTILETVNTGQTSRVAAYMHCTTYGIQKSQSCAPTLEDLISRERMFLVYLAVSSTSGR